MQRISTDYKRNFLIERLRLQNISVIGSSWYTCTIHQSSQKFVENRHVQNISINVIHPLKIPWSFVQRSILQSEYMNRSFITGYTKKCWIMTEVNAATETHTNLLLVLWGSRKACDSKLQIFQGLEGHYRFWKQTRNSGKRWKRKIARMLDFRGKEKGLCGIRTHPSPAFHSLIFELLWILIPWKDKIISTVQPW